MHENATVVARVVIERLAELKREMGIEFGVAFSYPGAERDRLMKELASLIKGTLEPEVANTPSRGIDLSDPQFATERICS